MAAAVQALAAPRLESHTRLVFRVRGGRTYLAEERVEAPVKILRPFLLPDERILLQLIQSTPGLFAGDRFSLDVVAEPGARVVLLQPAATKIHTMPEAAFASQHIRIEAASEASVELYPNLVIPFPGAEFRQRVRVELAADARFGYVESWSVGRIERGEEFAFRRLSSRLAVNRAGRPLYRDALELRAGARGTGVLDGRRYVVSGFWAGLPAATFDGEGAPERERLVATGPASAGGHYLRGLFRDSAGWQAEIRAVRAQVEAAWGYSEIPAGRFCC